MRYLLLLGLLGCGSEVSGVGQVEVSGEAGSSAEADGGAGASGSGGSAGAAGDPEGDASLVGFGGQDGGQDGALPDGGRPVQDGGQDSGEVFDPSFFVGRWSAMMTAQTDCDGKPRVVPNSGPSEIEVNSDFEAFWSNGSPWLKPGTFEADVWRPEPASNTQKGIEIWREGTTAAGRFVQTLGCLAWAPGVEVSMVWTRLAP